MMRPASVGTGAFGAVHGTSLGLVSWAHVGKEHRVLGITVALVGLDHFLRYGVRRCLRAADVRTAPLETTRLDALVLGDAAFDNAPQLIVDPRPPAVFLLNNPGEFANPREGGSGPEHALCGQRVARCPR